MSRTEIMHMQNYASKFHPFVIPSSRRTTMNLSLSLELLRLKPLRTALWLALILLSAALVQA